MLENAAALWRVKGVLHRQFYIDGFIEAVHSIDFIETELPCRSHLHSPLVSISHLGHWSAQRDYACHVFVTVVCE